MTKIVCDYDTVYANCNKLEGYINEMKQDIINQEKEVKSSLTWQGSARNEFDKSLSSHDNLINDDIAKLEATVKYMRESAKKIQELDRKLASIDF